MATRHWVGPDGSQSFQVDANWSATRGGAGGASYPTGNDEAYIETGSAKITLGMDNASFTGTLYVSFDGCIGDVGAPFTSNCNRITIARVGADSYLAGETAVIELNIYDASIASVSWVSGEATSIYLGPSGVFNMTGGSSDNVYTAGISVVCGGAVSQIDVYDGNHQFSKSVVTMNVHDGFVRMTGTAGITDGAGGGFLSVYGGTYEHNSSGTIDFVDAYPNAVLTAAGASAPFVITGGNRWVGASYFENSPVSITGTGATNPGRKGFGY